MFLLESESSPHRGFTNFKLVRAKLNASQLATHTCIKFFFWSRNFLWRKYFHLKKRSLFWARSAWPSIYELKLRRSSKRLEKIARVLTHREKTSNYIYDKYENLSFSIFWKNFSRNVVLSVVAWACKHVTRLPHGLAIISFK